jgi:hypothetical protein
MYQNSVENLHPMKSREKFRKVQKTEERKDKQESRWTNTDGLTKMDGDRQAKALFTHSRIRCRSTPDVKFS